jgi:hypothetical protein
MSTMTASPTFRQARPPRQAQTTRPNTPAGQVRLTRRGRLVVFGFALLVVAALGMFWAAGSVATEEPGMPEPTRVVMVGEGETLWGIAAGIADDGNIRSMVDRIERLNALDSAMVEAGQRLRVPLED